MTKFASLAGQRPFRRIGPAAGVLAVLACASACASGSSTAASSHPPSHPATTAAGTPSAATGGSAGAVDRTTPGSTLADWLHRLVTADYRGACQDMATEASGSAAPVPNPPSAGCPSAGTTTALKSLHGNFVADGLTPSSQITVVAPNSAAPSVVVNGTSVKVAGTNLTALMTAHSTGVKPGELRVSFTVSDVGGTWYVSDLSLDL